MKKKMLMAALAAMVALPTAAALANPVTLDGQLEAQYRTDNATDQDGGRLTFTLNAKTNIATNLDLYARLGAQSITEKGFGNDFLIAPGAYSADKKTVAEIDQFGFLYNNAGFNYKLGRQGATIGATALLYSTEGYIGRDIMADGLTVKGKSGVTDLSFTALNEVYEAPSNDARNAVYAVAASYQPAKDWTLGATWAKYDDQVNTTFGAVNAGYTCGKAGFAAEYAKSNADEKNKAYDLGVTYGFDSKTSVSATYYRAEDNGTMGAWTDFDDNYKGMYYGANYKFDDQTTLKVLYKDIQNIDDSATKSNQLRVSVAYKF